MTERGKQTVVQVFASAGWGGGEQYVYDLAERLQREGYGVQLVSRESEVIRRKTASLGCPLVQFPLRSRFGLRSILKMKRLIESVEADIVHTHQFKDTFIALFARALSDRKPKVILTRHLVRPAKRNFFYSYLYRRTDRIVFVSELARRVFLSSSPKIAARSVTVIHNSIPPCRLQTGGVVLRQRYGIPPDTVVVAYAGRLHPEKGVEVLLDAAALLKSEDFVLLVAGQGEPVYEQRLRDRAKALGLDGKVVFTGFLDDVPQFMRQVDIGVVPTVGQEAFGLTVLEFMQAGRAVITTDNGAQPEFVASGTDGILIPPSDAEALAAALRGLIRNRELRELLGAAAVKSGRSTLLRTLLPGNHGGLSGPLIELLCISGRIPVPRNSFGPIRHPTVFRRFGRRPLTVGEQTVARRGHEEGIDELRLGHHVGIEGGVAVGGITVQAYLYTVTSAAQFACQCYRGVGKNCIARGDQG